MTLETKLDGLPANIRADERKLSQIVYNLISNAVKFTPDGGRMTISGETLHREKGRWQDCDGKPPPPATSVAGGDGSWLKISVTDTGIGIPQKDLGKTDLRTLRNRETTSPTTRRFQGTGLGLSLTRKLVALHDGAVWAESPGPPGRAPR